MPRQSNSSWEKAADWYDKSVGEKGHYYHQQVIFPKLIQSFELDQMKQAKVLDLGCGQGILARHLPKKIPYLGMDVSEKLITMAKTRSSSRSHRFICRNVAKPFQLEEKDFTHAALILSLQNMPDPLAVFKNGYSHLKKGGKLFAVLNHPCFRIPRQSGWGVDEKKKWMYRRVDRYMSPLEIPISTHPGKKEKGHTISYHFPLSDYSKWLHEAGFMIEWIDEWCSDKKSTGKAAKMENFGRKEFPLFLVLSAKK